jgi:5-methyltetrahydrofolate--homocysteine methyltransferase
MELLQQIADSVIHGQDQTAAELTRQVIELEVPPKEVLSEGLIAGMTVVGERFKNHEIFLPDVLLASRAMCAGMDLLKPLLIKDGIPMIGKVVIGSVQGDLHDIGKNLVGIMLKGAGFDVIDLGNDVAPEAFVTAAKEHNASVVGMSALLTTTMPVMGKVVDMVVEQGLAGQIRTIVGGAPLSEVAAKEIGADAYGFDAANAVDRVKDLIGV